MSEILRKICAQFLYWY